MKPNSGPKPPLLVLLTSHWLSMAGVALVTLAGISWLFVLPASLRGHVQNPYIGLLLFVALPILFLAGLALIPIGIWLSRRSVAAGFTTVEDRRIAWRRAGIFFGFARAREQIVVQMHDFVGVAVMPGSGQPEANSLDPGRTGF